MKNFLQVFVLYVLEVLTCLNLGLPLSHCRLVDWHLHRLLVVSYNDGAQGTELRLKLLVVHRPEAMKEKVPAIPVKSTRGYR